MDEPYGVMGRIVQQDGLAIGEAEKEGGASLAGDESIRVGDHLRGALGFDDDDSIAVHLGRSGDLLGFETQVSIDPAVVLGHRRRLVAYRAADVQGSKGCLADAPAARKHGVYEAVHSQTFEAIG
jgi:hypothetical protein